MTGDMKQFTSLEAIDGGKVTFGDNRKGKIIDNDKICITSSSFIENILLVEGLKLNFLVLANFVIKSLELFLNHLCALSLDLMIMK